MLFQYMSELPARQNVAVGLLVVCVLILTPHGVICAKAGEKQESPAAARHEAFLPEQGTAPDVFRIMVYSLDTLVPPETMGPKERRPVPGVLVLMLDRAALRRRNFGAALRVLGKTGINGFVSVNRQLLGGGPQELLVAYLKNGFSLYNFHYSENDGIWQPGFDFFSEQSSAEQLVYLVRFSECGDDVIDYFDLRLEDQYHWPLKSSEVSLLYIDTEDNLHRFGRLQEGGGIQLACNVQSDISSQRVAYLAAVWRKRAMVEVVPFAAERQDYLFRFMTPVAGTGAVLQ